MDLSVNYDSYESMKEAIKSLENFSQLVDARHEAGYKRGERLRQWVLLGRFVLDSCGNFSKIIKDSRCIIPAEKYPTLPKVMFLDSVIALNAERELPDEHLSIGYSPSWLPPANQICPVCNKGWTIENCHDFVDSHKSQVVDLSPYTNQTIAYFKLHWNRSPKVFWFVQREHSLQNKRYIDHTIPAGDWKWKHQVNEHGWVDVKDDHVIEEGDHILVNIWTLRHEKCFRKRQAKLERAFFKSVFQSAGYKDIRMTEIPNQYDGSDCTACAPWYNVVADGIPFTIGWRKRVINISTPHKRLNLESLFRKEDVTKAEHYIHAWGRKNCVSYLKKIKSTVNSPFWFVHKAIFLPHLLLQGIRDQIGWLSLRIKSPELYKKLKSNKK